MGRKIPGKKHKTIKDPEKQREKRFELIKDKINAPPKSLDQEEIPKSLQRIINFKEKLKAGKVSLKRKRTRVSSKLISSETKSRTKKIKKKGLFGSSSDTPVFIQEEGENKRAFMRRIQETVDDVIKEAKFESKYDVKVTRNIKTGAVDVIKQPKDELMQLAKDIRKNEKLKGKKKKKQKEEEPRLTKSQKKTRKLAEKKARKTMNKQLDFSDYKDTIKFGDIVHKPPTLTAPKKVVKSNCAPRPGKKDLLLKSIIKGNVPKSQKKTVFDKICSDTKIDKKGKRKDLPSAIRRQLENQRSEVVNAYRMLKSKNSVTV